MAIVTTITSHQGQSGAWTLEQQGQHGQARRVNNITVIINIVIMYVSIHPLCLQDHHVCRFSVKYDFSSFSEMRRDLLQKETGPLGLILIKRPPDPDEWGQLKKHYEMLFFLKLKCLILPSIFFSQTPFAPILNSYTNLANSSLIRLNMNTRV